ncbi:Y-family DNA polymerase, partial [Staphylococcus aureus]|uniref:Y-family DNA polymerase n=1 Tax=Staphylococcus aureus TaxID=1280 RepID=UPI003F97F592
MRKDILDQTHLTASAGVSYNKFLAKLASGMNKPEGQNIFDALSQYEVKRRGDMEEDPSYKHLISYCLLENEHGEILVYERLYGGGEARLHGQSSIGVGGHMNDVPGAESINEV